MKQVRWYIVAFVLALGIVVLALSRGVGALLVSENSLAPAGAIVVLGGGVPFRAMEAAKIYHEALAPTVWLTQQAPDKDDLALANLGLSRTPEYVYSKQVLERLGVPSSAIRVLPERVKNTAEEVRCIAEAAEASKVNTVIVVTSKFHTRRVEILWRALTSGKAHAIVRYDEDPSDPQHWWRRTGDASAVLHETFAIVNAWAGFPIKTDN